MRWAVVKKIVDDLRPGSILEIGCGQGAFGARLAARATYLAVEPDPTSYAVARARIEPAGGEIRNINAGDLDDDQRFDLVCAFEVLEHIEDDATALKSWMSRVSPGGHLLVSMPAWQERFNAWDSMVGHFRRYSPEQATRLLADTGLADPKVTLYGWPLGYALELLRGRIAARRQEPSAQAGPAMAERTARSGRLLQPRAIAGGAARVGVAPFVAIQRLRPQSGIGLVAVGTAAAR